MNKNDYELLKDNIDRDVNTRKRLYDEIRAGKHQYPVGHYMAVALGMNITLSIKKVVFNNPATIIYWEDGSKTVVKADNEPFDQEKGLAMAIAKKALGNQGNYYNQIKKWLMPDSEESGNGEK